MLLYGIFTSRVEKLQAWPLFKKQIHTQMLILNKIYFPIDFDDDSNSEMMF